MRPKCEVMFRCGEIDCADCEITVAGNECECGVYDFSKDDRIAALTAALKELGVDVPLKEALDCLEIMFTKYENGVDCYENGDDKDGAFIGPAYCLNDEDFHRIADLLNAHRPRSPKTLPQPPRK